MTRHEYVVERLKEKGWRLTPQRLMILRAIAERQGHLGVDEVFRRVQEVYPYVDITTVYRTLHTLKKMGMVTEVGMGDRLHYELASPNNRHHHMVCNQCGGAYDLSPSYLEAFRRTLIKDFGFAPDLDNFTVTGTCSQCRKRQAQQ